MVSRICDWSASFEATLRRAIRRTQDEKSFEASPWMLIDRTYFRAPSALLRASLLSSLSSLRRGGYHNKSHHYAFPCDFVSVVEKQLQISFNLTLRNAMAIARIRNRFMLCK